MAARHPARQARILGDHGRRRRPGRVDALLRDARYAGPAALFARDRDRVADGLAGRRDEVQPAVAEADDDLALLVVRAETDVLAAAATDGVAAAPIPEQLRGRGLRVDRHQCESDAGNQRRAAQQTGGNHRQAPLSSACMETECPPCPVNNPLLPPAPYAARTATKFASTGEPGSGPCSSLQRDRRFQANPLNPPVSCGKDCRSSGSHATAPDPKPARRPRVCPLLCEIRHKAASQKGSFSKLLQSVRYAHRVPLCACAPQLTLTARAVYDGGAPGWLPCCWPSSSCRLAWRAPGIGAHRRAPPAGSSSRLRGPARRWSQRRIPRRRRPAARSCGAGAARRMRPSRCNSYWASSSRNPPASAAGRSRWRGTTEARLCARSTGGRRRRPPPRPTVFSSTASRCRSRWPSSAA